MNKNKRLIIIGAGGHGRVIADLAVRSGYGDIGFADDHATGAWMGFPVLGTTAELEAFHDDRTVFVIGIGNNHIREKIASAHDLPWATLVHPSAQIGLGVCIGAGTVVMANAVLNAGAVVGAHCIINTGAVVEHDNRLMDYVHISPKAALGGTVTVGARTHIGIGAVVRNNIDIGADCVVGAGAVVVRHLTEPAVYAGVPAVWLKNHV
ncbi:MAG: acetyltransferase [Clostridia bacterium]|nr:acetyltransferase [Clostridia bacterium]